MIKQKNSCRPTLKRSGKKYAISGICSKYPNKLERRETKVLKKHLISVVESPIETDGIILIFSDATSVKIGRSSRFYTWNFVPYIGKPIFLVLKKQGI